MQVNPHKGGNQIGDVQVGSKLIFFQGEHHFSNIDMDVGKDLVKGNVIMDHHVLVVSNDINMVDTKEGVVDVF